MVKKQKSRTVSAKREKQTRYLSQAIQLEESINPHIIRSTMVMVSLAIFAFILWSAFTNINEVARTPGEVVPHGHQQTVQHLEGGIVKAIHIREGDVVDTGQSLISMDDSSIKEDLERAQAKQLDLEMKAEKLRAFIDGREPDFKKFGTASEMMVADQEAFFEGMRSAREKEQEVVRIQIEEKKNSIQALNAELQTALADLKITEAMYDRREKLNTKGYASDMQLLEDESRVNRSRGEIKRLKNQIRTAQTAIREYNDRLGSMVARQRDEALEQLSLVTSEMAQNSELIQKLQERISRLNVRAPARGLVKGLAVNTIGSVIQPGQMIMEIVPLDERLEVAVKISPQDIGHLKIGQSVQVKFSTFDFSRYGSVKGKLDHISATTFSGDRGERYYQGRVLLEKNYVGNDPANIIMPGMTVMADVITGHKTILEYMLKPIHISLKTAFTER